MAFTESNMLPLGTMAPDFNLPDTVSGKSMAWGDVCGSQGTLLVFSCNHCPYVIHVIEELVNISRAYQPKGIATVFISSNDVANYPDDSPEKMTQFAAQYGFDFPYLYDETQAVARAYDAACTPDIYVFDADGRLYYRGRLDGARPKNDLPVTGEDLRHALNSLLDQAPAPEKQYPSGGCNIKWKAG